MTSSKVLVIRNDDKFSDYLRVAGFTVLNLPLIETLPVKDLSKCDELISRINEYDGLFFTSPVAAEIFFDRFYSAGASFGGMIYALGERARAVVERFGLSVCPTDADTAAEMIDLFGEREFANKKFLFVRGDKSVRAIPEQLKGKAAVDEVVVYETHDLHPNEKSLVSTQNALAEGSIDWVCFFSPSAVRSFHKLFPSVSSSVNTAAIGETTAEEMRRCNLNVNFISPRPCAEDFADGLIRNINTSE